MKINEQERVGLIGLLKEEYNAIDEAIANVDDPRDYIIAISKEMKDKCEILEKLSGEIEFDTNGFDLEGDWTSWVIILTIICNTHLRSDI